MRKTVNVKLKPYCTKIGSGITPRGGDTVYIDSGVALIRSQNVYNGSFIHQGLAFIDNDTAQKMRGVTLEKNDILLNITGDSVARCCMVPEEFLPARVNQHVSILRTNKKKLDSRFLMYYLVSPLMQSRMLSLAGSGGTRKALTKEMIEGFEIPLIELPNQQDVSSILFTYDDLIDTNRRRIQLLEEAARLLFREWFVYFRFPGHEKTKFEDRDGIQIPTGWDYLPITKVKIFKKTRIGVPVFVDTRQYYQTSEIDGTNLIGSGEEVDYENRPSRADVVPRLNSIYFAKMKDTDKVLYFNKGNAELLEKILLSTGMAGFSTDEKYLAFLFGLLTSYEFVQNKNNYATGATQVSLSDSGLKKIKVLFPKIDLIEQYSRIMNPLLEECSNLRKQNQKLAQARDLLLPRLMSGKIDVSKIGIKVVQEA